MMLEPERLRQLVSRTLDHYQARAVAFWEGTRNHDVEQNIAALLVGSGSRRRSRVAS